MAKRPKSLGRSPKTGKPVYEPASKPDNIDFKNGKLIRLPNGSQPYFSHKPYTTGF